MNEMKDTAMCMEEDSHTLSKRLVATKIRTLAYKRLL